MKKSGLPLIVSVTVVAMLAVMRLTRGPVHSVAPAPTSTVSVIISSAPAPPSSGLLAPLHGEDGGLAEGDASAPRMFHGDAQHRHRSLAHGPRAANVKWRADVGGAVAAQVTASPDEQTLYVATLGGSVIALAREDGAKRWTTSLGDRVYSTPLVANDGTLYVGSDAKKLVALSPDGAVLWRLEVEGEADSGPVLAGDGTIVFAAGPYVHAVRRGGDLAWRFAAKGKVFTAPALTSDGYVIVGSQDDHVYAIDREGKAAWSVDLGADVDGSPAIDDAGAIYVGTDKGEVVKLDAKGHVAWRTNVEGYVRGGLSVARNGDVLTGTYGPTPRVVRISPEGMIRGAFAIKGTGAREFGFHGGPLEDADGALFFGGQDDAAYALETDGGLRFRHETGADIDAPLTLLSDGSLVVPSEDGSVTLLLP